MEAAEKNEFLSDLEQLDSGKMEAKVEGGRNVVHTIVHCREDRAYFILGGPFLPLDNNVVLPLCRPWRPKHTSCSRV